MKKKQLKPRIALIKQTTAPDLYTKTAGSLKQILASSLLRTGPFELLASYQADLYIVDVPYGIACKAWKESLFLGEKTIKKLKKQKTNAASEPIRSNKTNIDTIPWHRYDIVISLSIAIPPRVIKKNREILWCYYIIDPNLTFLLSKRYYPFFRYNVFLDQNLPEDAISPETIQRFQRTGKVSIHFPYTMLDPGTFKKMFTEKKKKGCKIESRSMRNADPATLRRLKEFGPISQTLPKLTNYLDDLSKRKYFIILPDTKGLFRGNSLIEASAAGCLILAAGDAQIINKNLITKGCFYKDIDDLIHKIRKFEADGQSYRREINRQQLLNRQFANVIPYTNLVRIWKSFPRHPAPLSIRIRGRIIDILFFSVYMLNFLFFIRAYKIVRILLRCFSGKNPENIIRNIFNRKGKSF